MTNDIRKMMKIGIVYPMAYPRVNDDEKTYPATLETILNDNHFQAIELFSPKDSRMRTRVKDMLKDSGFQVGYCGQAALLGNKLNLDSLLESERKRAIETAKACVDEALFFNASEVVFVSGADPGQNKRAEAAAALVESLIEICRYAKMKNTMTVVLETFDRSIGKRQLLGPTGEAVTVARKVSEEVDNFGLLLDLSHLPLLSEKPADAVRAAAKYLKHIHIGNCVMRDKSHPAYGDEHPILGIEGGENGVAEVRDFLQACISVGFLNSESPPIVGYEVKPGAGQSPEETIARTKETVNIALSGLIIPG